MFSIVLVALSLVGGRGPLVAVPEADAVGAALSAPGPGSFADALPRRTPEWDPSRAPPTVRDPSPSAEPPTETPGALVARLGNEPPIGSPDPHDRTGHLAHPPLGPPHASR